MAIMSGCWGYRNIGRFVERHRRELIKIFKIQRGEVPSYSTIRRVMMAIEDEKLALVFNQWASKYTNSQSGQWIALDGKNLKNTVSNSQSSQQNFVTMVSAFSHERGEVLGLKVMENKKQSEIKVVQELLELLDLKNVVFTLDALHCQKKTLSAIIDSGNDYLVVVKRNQPSPRLQGKASTNISILKSWVLNLMRIHGIDSLTEAISELSHNLPLLKSFCY